MKLQDYGLLFILLCNEKSEDENLMNLDINCTRCRHYDPYPEFAGKMTSSSAYNYFPFFNFTF